MKANIFFILILSLYICSCQDNNNFSGKKVFRYNEPANITTLDPAFSRDQSTIWATNQIFNGLVQLNDKLNVIPCIAKSWTVSSDGLLYTFILRTDVSFHDNPCFRGGRGRKVNANDFTFSFYRLIDEKTASPGAWIFSNVDNRNRNHAFQAINDSVFTIRLKEAFPPFIGLLSMQYCSVIPKEAITYYGSGFRSHPVGTGPFEFKTWKEGVKLVLLRNQNYFEFENGERLPFIDAVSISFIADKQSAFLEFIKGQLDFMSGIDPTYKDELLTKQGRLKTKYASRIHLIAQPYLNTEYLGFMMDSLNPVMKNNPLKNLKVRQAINYSFDRSKMIQYLRNGIGTPGENGIVPEGLPSFDSGVRYYTYDPLKALQLLNEAGFPHGKGLAPVILTSTPDYLDICKYIQSQAGDLGIEINIEVSPPAAVKEMKAQAKLSFFRASWIADYPDAENYLSMFYSRNFCPKGPNYTHFSDPVFDELYDKSLSALNDSVRILYFRKMEKILMEKSPVVVLYYDRVLRFVRNNIKDIGSNPMNLLNLKRVRKL